MWLLKKKWNHWYVRYLHWWYSLYKMYCDCFSSTIMNFLLPLYVLRLPTRLPRPLWPTRGLTRFPHPRSSELRSTLLLPSRLQVPPLPLPNPGQRTIIWCSAAVVSSRTDPRKLPDWLLILVWTLLRPQRQQQQPMHPITLGCTLPLTFRTASRSSCIWRGAACWGHQCSHCQRQDSPRTPSMDWGTRRRCLAHH